MKNKKPGLTSDQIEAIADRNSYWQRSVDEFKKSQAGYKRGLTSIDKALKQIDFCLSLEQREALAEAKRILISYKNDLEVAARRAGRMVLEKEQARKIEDQKSNERVFHKIFNDANEPYAVFTAIGTTIVGGEHERGSDTCSINAAARLLSKVDSADKYCEAAGIEMIAAARKCNGRVAEKIETAIVAAKLKSSVTAIAAEPAAAIGL